MNIRAAILAAADHIERNPQDFDYTRIETPHACGTPACALGWIAHFSGYFARQPLNLKAFATLGVSYWNGGDHFEQRMNDLHFAWKFTAADCAFALRLYADKYHPAQLRTDAELVEDLKARIAQPTLHGVEA